MEIILIILFVSFSILTIGIMFITPLVYTIYFSLLQILVVTGLLLLVFLGPHIQFLNEEEEKNRKRYETLQDNIFKQPWLDAVRNRNRYYLITFLLFAFLPFFWTCLYVYLNPTTILTNFFDNFDTFLLFITSGFEGFVILVYTLFSQKPWYFYIVPLFYGIIFVKTYLQNTNTLNTLKNYAECFLLILFTFIYFSKSSFVWSIPFLIILSLFMK